MMSYLSTVRISVPHTAEYSSNNTLCISSNSGAPPAYRLEGCPTDYFDTYQGTGGACIIPAETGTDVLLTNSELPEGLYQFICSVNNSYSINSNAIVGKYIASY